MGRAVGQSMDEVRISGVMGLSMAGPAAYFLGVRRRPVSTKRDYFT